MIHVHYMKRKVSVQNGLTGGESMIHVHYMKRKVSVKMVLQVGSQ